MTFHEIIAFSSVFVPQVDCESNGGIITKLPSIKEDEEGSGSEGEHSPLPKVAPVGRLGRGLRSPMRSPLRSPLLPGRTIKMASDHCRPTSLQIPVVSFTCLQPDLSPRLVTFHMFIQKIKLSWKPLVLLWSSSILPLCPQVCGWERGRNPM